jgi:hypothetical protein
MQGQNAQPLVEGIAAEAAALMGTSAPASQA